MHGESGLPSILMYPLMMKGMLATILGQEPHPVSLCFMMRSATMNVDIKVRLVKAWKAML